MRAKYTEEFKSQAVAIALESDRPYKEIALDLGVNLWWDAELPEQTSIWESYVDLSTDFLG